MSQVLLGLLIAVGAAAPVLASAFHGTWVAVLAACTAIVAVGIYYITKAQKKVRPSYTQSVITLTECTT